MRNIITVAQERGSAAKTKSGAWKYLLAHLPAPHAGLVAIGTGRLITSQSATRYLRSRIERSADGRAHILGYDPADPNTPGRILDAAHEENRNWDIDRGYSVERNNYGQLFLRSAILSPAPRPELRLYRAAQQLIGTSNLPSAYDNISWERDRRGRGEASGTARHHEIYDIADGACVVCVRSTEGTRWGVKTTSKTYYIIIADGAIKTSEPVAKLAKSDLPLGAIIARIQGDKNIKCRVPALTPQIHYKALALVDGQLRSIYSGEAYTLGKTKIERAVEDHGGGYYCYATAGEAASCEVPTTSKYFSAPRVIVQCDCWGNRVRYDSGKMAYSFLRPVAIIQQSGAIAA